MSAKLKISLIIVAVFFIVLAIVFLKQEETADIQLEHDPNKDADLTVEIVPAPNDTYGYNIKLNGRIIIRPPDAPALPGLEGLNTKEDDARKVAELVINKIRNNHKNIKDSGG